MTDTSRPTYDIIFAGGGASACIEAGRLIEADPNLKILVLEAGTHSQDVQEHVQPGRYFSSFVQPRETFTFYTGKVSEKLGGRSAVTATGRCVGGGSCVNFVVYARAATSDFDDWENVYGNKGWGSKDIIPLLRKAETYQAVSTNGTHGTSGPIKVSFAKSGYNVGTEFLEAASHWDKDRGPIDDLNGLHACDGYGRFARFVDGETGKRSDTAHHYLYPKLGNKNLTLDVRKRVVRVILEGTRAVGVEYIDDAAPRPRGAQPLVAYASKLVILTAGAFGSPAILERSGIGGSQILRKNDIQQVVDLPGVGDGYMDHNVIFQPFLAAEYADTMDAIFRGGADEVKPFADQWLANGQGLMQHNAMDAGVKLRPTAKDLEDIGPTFTERWNNYFANAPDKPVMLMASFAAYVGPNPNAPRRKYFSIPYYSAYPASQGYTHITSGGDAYAPLDFDPGYLNDDGDLNILRWGYKHGREIARRMPAYRGEYADEHPAFPPGSDAAAGPRDGPVPANAPAIKYTPEDDRAIDEYNKKFLGTTWHSCGTCSMKPRDKGGVVDERLNVYGIQNLKVADLSIIPGNVSANTYNTTIAVGEKASVIIAQDLGIKGVTESD